MSDDNKFEDTPILIELQGMRGVVDVSRLNEQELAIKSAEAINNAMATIHNVAKRTTRSIRSINVSEQPDSIEITFGLKLTTEANALIVNAGIEAQIEVKLTWNNK